MPQPQPYGTRQNEGNQFIPEALKHVGEEEALLRSIPRVGRRIYQVYYNLYNILLTLRNTPQQLTPFSSANRRLAGGWHMSVHHRHSTVQPLTIINQFPIQNQTPGIFIKQS